MHSTETAPLKELLTELDMDSEHDLSNEGHRQKRGRTYRSSGEDFQLGDDKPPMSKRVARGVALFVFAVLIGIGGTLASQSYRDGWLSPVSATTAPAPSVTAADLQEQLKPLAVDLALMRRSVEQLGSNLDQLARRQDQLAQNMATLLAAQQQVSQTGSTPPPPPKVVSALPSPPKAVHVPLPPPKVLRPPAE